MSVRHPTLLRTTLATALALSALAATAQSADPVRIGLLSTLSGPGAGLGVDIRDGFQLAVKLAGRQARWLARRGDRGRRPGQPRRGPNRPQTAWSSATRWTS
jgi:outer membrane PBP1 activator LpoA protein